MLHAIASAFIGVAAFISSLFGAHQQQDLGAALPQGTAVFETSLQSRISSTDTSLMLVANSVRGGSSLSGYNCFTLDEGRTDAEYVCGTISGTSVTSLTRGVDPSTGTTSNSALKFAHRVGADIKITDFPLIQILRNQSNGSDTFDNVLRYTNKSASDFTNANDIINKAYADNLAFGAIPAASETAGGFVELATQVETASSTSSGSVTRLAIPASVATSSYNSATASLRVVVTDNNGFIDQGFVPSTITKSLTLGSLTLTSTSNIGSSSIKAFTASTTPSTTWSKPANLKYVRVVVQGPGGKAVGDSSCVGACAGGGAGGYGEKIIPAAALGSTETVVVGGGAAQIASAFGSWLSCTAGTGGSAGPGTGGICTGADITVQGGTGQYGISGNSIEYGGSGGNSFMGFGGSGSLNSSATAIAAGNAGQSYGGGGGACADATDSSPGCTATETYNGGDGAVFVYQFFY